MAVNINIKRTYKINGKEYTSIEDMPENIREAFKNTMALQAGSRPSTPSAGIPTKIIFNDTAYESIEAMPESARQLCDKIMETAESGSSSPGINTAELAGSILQNTQSPGSARQADAPQPVKFEASFSLRTLLVGAVVSALLILVYFLWQNK